MAPPLASADGLEHLVVAECPEPLGDPRLLLQQGKVRGVVDDLQVVPQLGHDGVDRAAAVRERQDADDLREVGVRRRADEQATRLIAVLVGVPAEPRPRAPAGAEGIDLEQRGLVEPALLAALAADDEVREIAARSALVEPELPPAVVLGTVDEATPVEVVHVPLRAGPHEAGRDHRAAVEAAPLVERPAVDEPARALSILASALVLHHEPLGKPPGADALAASPEDRSSPAAVRRALGPATPVMSPSFRASRGSAISSRSPGLGHVSRPPTIAECRGRSISAPGP